MPLLDVAGGRLYYETAGSGPALIFAHGLGGGHLSWWQQVPAFRNRYTCVTFDHRGFGMSEDSDGRGADAFADDLAALINHLGVEDVRLVAQSMGGWTSLAYALHHPGRVRALVLASTTGIATAPEIDAAFAAQDPAAGAALFARGIHPACGERLAREQPALHHLYLGIDGLSPNLDKERLRRTLGRMRATPVERIAALRLPVQCITGDEDVVIPPAAVAALAAALPNARLERIPAAGHSTYWERPETFNRLLAAFLSEVDG